MVLCGTYGLAYLTVGSFGIALYRALYIRHDHWVKYHVGEKNLLILILTGSVLLSAGIVFLYAIERSSALPAINACTGLSVTETQILIDYQSAVDENILTTAVFRKTAIVITLSLQAGEFGIYLGLFYFIYKHDNGSITKVLNQSVVRDRNRKNLVSFLGQFYGFVVECIFLIIILVLSFLSRKVAHEIHAITIVVKFLDFGVLSAVEILSSASLKQSLNKGILG